jgi:hypothetical protein
LVELGDPFAREIVAPLGSRPLAELIDQPHGDRVGAERVFERLAHGLEQGRRDEPAVQGEGALDFGENEGISR